MTTDSIPAVGRGALRERVTEALERAILMGDWLPGERLPTEFELGERLRVSRTVVRDALRALATRGLVEIRQGVGTTVTAHNDTAYADAIYLRLVRAGSTVGDLAAAREVIERITASAAAARRTGDDLAKMRRHLDDLRAAFERKDWEAGLEAHLRWHLAIIAATHLPVLQVLLEPMHRIILESSRPPVLDDPQYWELGQEEEILAGIRDQDPERVDAAVRRHFTFVHDSRYRDRFQKIPSYDRGSKTRPTFDDPNERAR